MNSTDGRLSMATNKTKKVTKKPAKKMPVKRKYVRKKK